MQLMLKKGVIKRPRMVREGGTGELGFNKKGSKWVAQKRKNL